MISYYTRIKVNEHFNNNILFNMVLNWLDTTRNKMEGLSFNGKLPFSYETGKKKLTFDWFKQHNIYAVQFVTKDNRKNAQFVVEAIYHSNEQWVDLYFNKQLTENSKYIPGTNIPGVFKQLLSSEYVLEKISEEPLFLSYHDFKNIIINKPIVVLGRNKRCCVSPFELSKLLFGLSEVVCVPTKQNPYMKISDFNGKLITFSFENEKDTSQKVLEYLVKMLYEYYQPKTYDFLVSQRLHDEHQTTESFHQEMLLEAKQIVDEQNNSFEFLKAYYDDLLVEYNELVEKKKEIDDLIYRYKKEYFLLADIDLYQEQEALMIELLKQELMRLNNGNVYRRKHIVESIMEADKDEY